MRLRRSGALVVVLAVTGAAQAVVSSIDADLVVPKGSPVCSVTPFAPRLGFDFLFHTGYRIRIPMRDLARVKDRLTISLRVRSEREQDRPALFVQEFRTPSLDASASGNAVLSGTFRLGEGRYHAELAVRDVERCLCASSWDVTAEAVGKDLPLAGRLERDVIRMEGETAWPDKEDAAADVADPLHVKVIVNFAPQRLHAAGPGQKDVEDLTAILRRINRDPHISRLSIAACSLRTQQMIYREARGKPRIDLQALSEALNKRNFSEVDAKQLARESSRTSFLTQLLTDELAGDPIDGLIFIGPKDPLDANVSRPVIEKMRALNLPVFYLNYNRDASYYPWPDAFGWVVKQLRGVEYTIARPRDLFQAWSDIVSRLAKVKAPTISMTRGTPVSRSSGYGFLIRMSP